MVKKFRIIIVIIVLIAIAAGIVAAFRYKMKRGSKPTTVRVDNPERGELIEFVSAPGEIEPKTKVEISAKVSARIVELPYDEGDRVTCGNPNANPPIPPSVLVRLDSKDLETRLTSAEAGRAAQVAQIEVEKARIASQQSNLAGLEASLNQARRDLERQNGLLQSKDIAQATYDQAKTKYDELNSQYEAARHTLESARLNLEVLKHNLEVADAGIEQAREALSHTVITSPIDGVVTRLDVEVGEMVIIGTMNNPGTVIMDVGDLSKMLVVAQIDESDVGKLKVGQKANIHIDAFPEREFTGVVDSIALSHNWSNTMTKYYRTEILLDTTEEKLYSGLTAHAEVETNKYVDVLKVPAPAVLGREVDSLPIDIRENSAEVDQNKTFTTVVYRYIDGKAVVTPVKIGQSDLTHIVIKSGITEQDNVIVGPYKVLESIKHGQLVLDERQAQAKKKEANEAGKKETQNDANDSSKN